jgi:cobalt-zinc-cadmium efflux system protein
MSSHAHPGGTAAAAGPHAGHVHVTPRSDTRRLAVALGLIGGFMAVEVVVAILADSLALLADAAHMLTDAGALALALVVIRLAARPAGGNLTFGLKRAEILSAQANGFTLLVLALLIVYEGIRRLLDPPEPAGLALVVVAVAGVAVNLAATQQLARANRESLNVEGAFQHILTDLLAFTATAIAGILILTLGWVRADGVAALFVAAIMLRAAYGLLRDSGRILLEAAPKGVRPDEVGQAMAEHPRVDEVHDLHVWTITSGFPALSAHVLVPPNEDCHGVRRELESLLRERFGLEHTTLQVDHSRPRGPVSVAAAPPERDGL